MAVFAHFTGARRDEGRDAGNTVSVVICDGWTWWIPLEHDVTSVGIGIEGARYKNAGRTPEQRHAVPSGTEVPSPAPLSFGLRATCRTREAFFVNA